jgi:predicted metal-dependent HD superfamily phosphohydrolase
VAEDAVASALTARFRELWRRGVRAHGWETAFAALDAGYGSPARAYHAWSHIADLLQRLDGVRDAPEFAGVAFDDVELAVFFHDAVYDPRRHDNEARSAALFLGLAAAGGAADERLRRVASLIAATAAHPPSSDRATQLMLDLDLGILAAPPEVYASYVAGVRREYGHVPDPAWARGRIAVLDRFLARDRIYQTAVFFARLEAGARANLQTERRQLAGA